MQNMNIISFRCDSHLLQNGPFFAGHNPGRDTECMKGVFAGFTGSFLGSPNGATADAEVSFLLYVW